MAAQSNGTVNGFKLPTLKDLTIDNITENVVNFNSQGKDPRMKFILERLVKHLHDFARETRLSTAEWRAGLDWLEDCGHICTGDRKELITVSDVLGLSALVDEIDHPKPRGATEGTILGPFHTLEAEQKENGETLTEDPNGEPLFVVCSVKDTKGNPVVGAEIHVWEADSEGQYDIEKPDRSGPDGRGILHSDEKGLFYFDAIVPVPYPILCDGPVGKFLDAAGRHPYRPSHMHFLFEKPGYDNLITAVYLRGSKYEESDAVFGVKESLMIDIVDMDQETATKYNRPNTKKLFKYDFVLASDEEANALRDRNSIAALQKMGREPILANHAPAAPQK